MRCKSGKHPARNAAIAIRFARPEYFIRLIHHHNHRSQSADGQKDSHLLTLSVSDPFRPELTHFHHRQSTFTRKTIDEERLADTDTSRNQNASLNHISLAVLDEPRQFAQLLFR